VGGYTTFYVPDGAQVVDAAFLMPNGSGGYDRVDAKGQALIPNVGAGGGPTVNLATLGLPTLNRGPNIVGVTAPLVNPTTNANNGTLPGVYGDLGIFFSTSPETAYGSYTDLYPTDNRITNNSGDWVGLRTPLQAPLNLWDAWQMAGFGINGTANPNLPATPRVDSNGRGNTLWGVASAVAGPQSGYAWDFELPDYAVCAGSATAAPTASCINAATDEMGPWQRVQYPGSQIAYDVPGDTTLGMFVGGMDASHVGHDLSVSPLPAGTNAIRFAYGQLTNLRPEFAWVQFEVTAYDDMLDPTGCPIWRVDTFGGDAGGDDSGKDHIWRYYDPNSVRLNGCLAAGKPATRDIVKVGDAYQYQLKLYNVGNVDLTNVVVTDLLPSGVTFLSATPAQSSGPNPLRWVIGNFNRGQSWQATVTVKASSSGILNNTMTVCGITTFDDPLCETATDKVTSGLIPYLRQGKSVTLTSAAPGTTVAYTIKIDNIGTGATGSPIRITDYLPDGFTYAASPAPTALVNGAVVLPTLITPLNPNQPVFSIPAVLQAGQSLFLTFSAQIAPDQAPGEYCNSYTSSTPVNQTTGSLACLTVGGAAIGDTIWRDWDGDGVQDAGEEGIAGVEVKLYAADGTTLLATTTTDANGNYYFNGLTAGTYVVEVNGGTTLPGTTQTGDPDAVCPGTGCNNTHTVNLNDDNHLYMDADFGYQPTGTGSIGDTIFEDIGNDGVFNAGTDIGISGVTIYLYEDTNGDGVITPDVDALVATTTTDSNGSYSFTGLAEGYDYLVYVNQADSALTTYFGADPYQASTANPHPVDNLTGAYTAADIGFWRVEPGSIGDQVFIDTDGDGLYDSGDVPLAGVTITLYRDGQPIATTVSAADGTYLFDNLGPGNYTVVVDASSAGVPAGHSPSISEYTVSLEAGEAYLDADFPFVPLISKSVDKTYVDPSGDLAARTLTFGVTVNYPGIQHLENVIVRDFVPAGTTFDEAFQGGTLATFSSQPGTTGINSFGVTNRLVYAFQGGSTAFWAYDPSTNSWDSSSLPAVPGSTATGSALTNDGERYLYAFQGGSRAFYRYDAILNVWSDAAVTDLPLTASVTGAGASLVYLDGYIYAFPGGGTREFWRYNVADNTWTRLSDTSDNVGAGGSLATDGTDVFALLGNNSNRFRRFDVETLAWGANLPNTPDAINTGGALVSADDGNFYATRGNNEDRFYQYDGTAWSSWTRTGPTVGAGGDLATNGTRLFVLGGNSTTNFFERFSGSTTPLAAAPATVTAGGGLTYLESPDGLATSQMSASPDVIALGSSSLVVMTLEATSAVNNVVPSALTIHGGSAACTGPTPSSLNLVANTPATFTWSCTPAGLGEFTFSATASNGTVNFETAKSNSGLVSPEGQNQYVAWNLGSTTDGVPASTATSKYIYAFQGNDALSFWSYNTATDNWNNPLDPADTPTGVTVKEGGALTNDGLRYIYALRGDATRVFLRYDTQTNTWDDTNFADLPGTTDKTVFKGGALVYLNGYVYAFIGNDSQQFWRYNINDPDGAGPLTANSWTQMISTPGTVNNGAGLTTDGTNIYATQGDGKTGFWRYNVAANTWTALAPAPAAGGDGGGLVYANGAIYVLRGGGKPDFRRYNIASNTWTSLTAVPANVDDGGAITSDGQYIYVLRGRSNIFYRYTISANTWETRAITPANIAWGGAMTYLETGNVTHSSMMAYPMLVTDGPGDQTVVVQLTLSAQGTVNNIIAGAISAAGLTGGAATCGSPTLKSADDDLSSASDTVVFEWICTVTDTTTTNPGSVTFSANASSTSPVTTFGTATSNSVLLTPPLSWQAVVNNPGPVSGLINNTALLNEAGGIIENVPSNTTQTATTASIGDRVWNDANGDGVQDAGELGLAGVEVCVYQSNGVTLVGCDTTDANGNYRIYGLPAGDYVVRANPDTYPAGYLPTTSSALNVTGLTAGQQYNDADFGLQTPGTGSIGNYIWLDRDGDGVQDVGEAGLPGIALTLEILVGEVWTPVATTTTDANGAYLFDGLRAGEYRVTVDPTSQVSSPYTSGTFDLGDATAPTYDLDGTGTAHVATVTLATDASVSNEVDFGYNWSGSIGDFVWWDTNADGLQNESPLDGIPGAFVMLYFDADGDGVLNPVIDYQIAFAFTDANGAYLFSNLPPGNYMVDVYEDSITSDGNRDIVPTTGETVYVALGAGQNFEDADFGYFEGALVQGNVWHDDNRNGIIDGDEEGLEGITVTLWDEYGNVVATTTTDENGHYFFIVPEGNYTLTYNTEQTAAAGYLDSTTPTSFTFHAYPGEDWHPSFDFGVDYSGAIGDRVWNDADNSGTLNGSELGLPGVTVNLYASDGTTLLAATVTDANGNYLFDGLADGTYVVKVDPTTLPAGFNQTYDNFGGLDHSGQAAIINGSTNLTADFGYYNAATYPVSGTLWHDADGEGDFDETLYLANVTVCLYDSSGAVVACTVTNASGYYEFPGIPDGDYTIQVNPSTLPNAAYVPTYDPNGIVVTPHETTITVSGAPVSGQNFGYQEQLGSLSGTICQGNGDGDCDNEPALSGVPVFLTWAGLDGLLGTEDDVVYVTTTDVNGDYTFTDLQPGPYQVTKINPSGYTSLADIDGGNPSNISVNLSVGQNLPNQDFELQQAPGNIGDRVWLDADGDGVQDVGEPGLANVSVLLYAVGPDGLPGGGDDILLATTTTDANGNYLFADVPAGDYYVALDTGTLPTGLTASPGTYTGTEINLLAGQSYLEADFGYVPSAGTAAIGDFIWADADGDGIQDPGEIGIAGVTVALKDSSGNTVATTTTGPDGRYLFTNVPPGSYTVEVTPPAGYTVTSGPESEGANTSRLITVRAGDVVTNVDFGYDNPALWSISDRLWYDADRDGLFDAGESGIGGVTVNLLDEDGNIVATVVTSPDGTFTFSGVPNGDYTIQIADNSGQLNDYQYTTPDADAGYRDVTVAGADVTGNHFGYAGLGPIGDTIWSDADGDGVQDPGEIGIAGVTVELYYDTNGDGIFNAGDTLIATEITDAGGHYQFNDLPSGTFFAVVTPPAGYSQTGDPDASLDHMTSVTLTPESPSFLGADFGYQSTTPLADVSGSIWNDINRNAVDEGLGEPPIAGVTVALLDSSGNVVATTVTGSDGSYAFYDVPAGNYTVAVADNDNVLDGYQLTSGLDAIPVTVGTTDITGIDFGYVRDPSTAVIGDRIWMDADGDGVQDAGETGLGNVTVRLYDTNDNLIATTTTDLNGNYLFTGLPAGSYYVAVDSTTLPNGGAGLSETTGGNDNRSATVNLSQGQVYLDADLGYSSTTGSALGDRIWYDANGDGVQDPGEVGIEGVTVVVYDSSSNLITTVVTGPDGSWLVPGLTAGTYTVVVTPPAGYNALPTNGSASRDYIVNGVNDVLYADFGFNGGTMATIGDRIWLDADGDGVQDAGEADIPGVTVNLLDGDGNIIATAITDANGNYQFSGVPDGSYTVQVTDMNNVLAMITITGDPDGSLNGQATLVISAGHITQIGSTPCTGCDNDLDFGYRPSGGVIGNQVWHDLDGDGLHETGEPGIQGVTISLWVDTNDDGIITPGVDNLVRTTITDENGQYSFVGLPAGKYLVDVTDRNGVLTGFEKTVGGTPGANDNSQADPYRVGLVVSGGVVSSNYTADFGYTAPETGYSISGVAFGDSNNNGATLPHPETGEQPIPGATIYLYRVVDGEQFLIGTTISDADGFYEFVDLPNGDYIVRADANSSLGAALKQTTQTTTGGVQPVTILNADSENNDFGFYAPSNISNFVWYDTDGDGIQDAGEPGVSGVVVNLYDTNDNLIATTTTDASGNYQFLGVLPGEYYVEFEQPFGYDFTDPAVGGDHRLDSNANLTTGRSDTFKLGPGQTDVTLDAGLKNSQLDYGDLPASYDNTLLGEDGARHQIGLLHLGADVNADADGQENDNALRDNHDDGVYPVSGYIWAPDETVAVNVIVTGGAGYLVAWMDWNNNGTFEPGEMVEFGAVSAGSQTLMLTIPADSGYVTGTPLYTRFRLYETNPGTATPTGLALNGEVEDHRWYFTPNAVDVLAFYLQAQAKALQLNWDTASELEISGYNIYRSTAVDGEYTRINADLVGARGGGSYTWLDTTVQPGVTYYYQLQIVQSNGDVYFLETIVSGSISGMYIIRIPFILRTP